MGGKGQRSTAVGGHFLSCASRKMSAAAATETSYTFPKPEAWPYLPLFEKIRYYSTILDAKYAPFVDKLEAKEKVAALCPEVRTATVVKVLEAPSDLVAADLLQSQPCLLKATHGCGWNHILSPTDDLPTLQTMLAEWNKPYSGDERQYTYLKPRFFIETIVDDVYTGKSGKARVFMIRCIHGKPVSVGVRAGNGSNVQNSYSLDFTLVEKARFAMEKPAQWEAMLDYATKLSAPFEFVRIDFYLATDGNVYFSEFTFTPAGGHQVFSIKREMELGLLWT